MPFIQIKNIIKKTSNSLKLKEQIQSALIVEESDKILKKLFNENADEMRTLYIKKNILNIACLSSVSSQEIKLNENYILEKLNKKFSLSIERIKIVS